MKKILMLLTFATIATANDAIADPTYFPPGQFSINGIAVYCGSYPTIVTTMIPDGAMFNGQAILMNPAATYNLPTAIKLYIYAHECAHGLGYTDEMQADCVAIKTGRNQGWFPPNEFSNLMILFHNNIGSLRHPPGPIRVNHMLQCYQDLSS